MIRKDDEHLRFTENRGIGIRDEDNRDHRFRRQFGAGIIAATGGTRGRQ
jgi:hypothetical protein